MAKISMDVGSVHELVDGVPCFDRFRTVHELEKTSRELAEKYAATVEWRRIGEEDLVKKTDREMKDIRWKKISIVFQGAMNALNPVIRVGDQVA